MHTSTHPESDRFTPVTQPAIHHAYSGVAIKPDGTRFNCNVVYDGAKEGQTFVCYQGTTYPARRTSPQDQEPIFEFSLLRK